MKFEEISRENKVIFLHYVERNRNNHRFNTGHNSRKKDDSEILGPHHSNLNRKNVLYVSRLNFIWSGRAFAPSRTAPLVPPAKS